MRQFDLNDNVDTIICSDEDIYFGSYDLIDNRKLGHIHKLNYKNFLDPNIKNLIYTSSVETTGTFDLKKIGSIIVAANYKDLTLLDKDLNNIKKIYTPSFNTKIAIKDDFIIIADGLGNISIYDQKLELIKSHRVSRDILWIVEVHNNLVYCGGEDSILNVLSLKDLSIKYQIQFSEGITSFYFEEDYFLVGSYDENIYKLSYNGQILNKSRIGGGIWRIEKKGSDYVVSCMYEGCKLLNYQFDILKTFQSGSLTYSLAVIYGKIFFNSFYKRKLYVI